MNLSKDKRITDLEDSLFELQESNKHLMEQCADYKQTIAGFVEVKASFEQKEKNLIQDHKAKLTEMEKEIAEVRASVAREVNLRFASVGGTTFVPEEVSPDSHVKSEVGIYNHYLQLPDKEKMAFYKEHSKTIDKLAKQEVFGS